MKFIADILLTISNATLPIAYIIIIVGLLTSLLRGFGKIKKLKNNILMKKIKPEVERIKAQYTEENEQLEQLDKLYKENNFSAILPIIFQVLSTIFYIIMLTTVFSGDCFNLENYTKSIGFFTIENIFQRNILIFIPIVIVLIKVISKYLFIPKELFDKKTLLTDIVLFALITGIFTNLFSTSYALFVLGRTFGEIITNIPHNKIKRKFFYEYPPTPEELEAKKQKKKTAQTNKKSFKETIKDLETNLENNLNNQQK